MTSDRMDRVADEWAIRDTLARYWRGVDRRDAALVASTYHPDAYDDHGYFKGPVAGFVETLAPSVWGFFENTQHFSGHIAVDFDPVHADRARAESYAEAHHIRRKEDGGCEDLVYGLRYVDRFERRAGEWRIAHRVCTWDWSRIDPAGGISLPEAYYRGAHSQADPVFAHPARIGRPASPRDLAIKQACLETLARYARGVDRCVPDLVAGSYHADAYDDHGGYQGDAQGFVAWVKSTVMDAFSCTMHKLGNCLIEVSNEGDRAYAETYAIVHHVLGQAQEPSDLIMGVRYIDELEDRGAGWKIAHRRMSFEWERSVALGPQRAFAGFALGRRDGADAALKVGSSRGDQVSVPEGALASPASADSAGPVAIDRVADRAEIYATLVRYCRGVDRRDSEMVRSAYHADAYDDHGAYKGDLDGFIAFVETEVHARFENTMHKLGQALIEFEGDEATSETYAICHHLGTDGGSAEEGAGPGGSGAKRGDRVMGIRYLDRFEKREGEWRIASRQLIWEWVRHDVLSPLDPDWTLGIAGASDPVMIPNDRVG